MSWLPAAKCMKVMSGRLPSGLRGAVAPAGSMLWKSAQAAENLLCQPADLDKMNSCQSWPDGSGNLAQGAQGCATPDRFRMG
jgi:hypothetical protein